MEASRHKCGLTTLCIDGGASAFHPPLRVPASQSIRCTGTSSVT